MVGEGSQTEASRFRDVWQQLIVNSVVGQKGGGAQLRCTALVVIEIVRVMHPISQSHSRAFRSGSSGGIPEQSYNRPTNLRDPIPQR